MDWEQRTKFNEIRVLQIIQYTHTYVYVLIWRAAVSRGPILSSWKESQETLFVHLSKSNYQSGDSHTSVHYVCSRPCKKVTFKILLKLRQAVDFILSFIEVQTSEEAPKWASKQLLKFCLATVQKKCSCPVQIEQYACRNWGVCTTQTPTLKDATPTLKMHGVPLKHAMWGWRMHLAT